MATNNALNNNLASGTGLPLTTGVTGVLPSANGGTGVNNGSSTVTLGGSLTTSGAFTSTFTMTGNTSVTFPTSGTLATTSQIPSVTPAALTRVDDTNVTLTLGGTPSTALLQATSITAGWSGQLAVSRGGTGLASATAYAVLCGGTTSTGALQSVASVGTSGQVLTSNGAGALPTFQTASSVSAATQAEQEAGSLTTVYTSPGRQQYHPSACKYWMNLHGTDTFAVNQSYNISSATDLGVGSYSYNITVAFSAATECIVVNAFSNSGDRNNVTVGTSAWATGSGQLTLRNQAGTLVDYDNTCVAGFGDQ